MQNSDQYKLPFRHWLTHQIDNGVFPGLQWEERKIDGGTFRLPWEKKNGVGWEHQLRLYKAWALHRGNNVDGMSSTSLKSNFRLNINKNGSFKELKDNHHLGKQCGNYKVYKLLSREEMEEHPKKPQKSINFKMRKRKKVSGSEQISVSNLDSCSDNALSAAKCKKEQEQSSAHCSNKTSPENARQCSPKAEVTFATTTPSSAGSEHSAIFRKMSNFFNIEIYYNGRLQLQHDDLDLSQGLRMHYRTNKNSERGEVIQKYNNSLFDGSSVDDFTLVEIEFPKPANLSASFYKFLKPLLMGLTIRYDNQKLLVNRSCQLHIFGIGSSNVAKKIERNQEEVITDFKKMRLNGSGQMATMCTWLVCGANPKQTSSYPGKAIWVKFVPSILAQFNQKVEAFTSDCRSIQKSEMTDLERLLDSLYMDEQA